MTIGRIEQLTAHVNSELTSIKTRLETWQQGEIKERDTEIARLNRKVEELHIHADENRRLLFLFRSMWAIVMGDTPGPPAIGAAVDEMDYRISAKDMALCETRDALSKCISQLQALCSRDDVPDGAEAVLARYECLMPTENHSNGQ